MPSDLLFIQYDLQLLISLACPMRSSGWAVANPVRGPETCAVLRLTGIGEQALITEGLCRPPSCTVEHRTGVPCSIGAASVDLQGKAIIQIPGDWTPDHGDATKPISIKTGNREFVADRRLVMPVMIFHEGLRCSEIAGHDFEHDYLLMRRSPGSQTASGCRSSFPRRPGTRPRHGNSQGSARS